MSGVLSKVAGHRAGPPVCSPADSRVLGLYVVWAVLVRRHRPTVVPTGTTNALFI